MAKIKGEDGKQTEATEEGEDSTSQEALTADKVAEMANAAVSSQLTRFKKSFQKEVTDSFAGILAPLQEQLGTLAKNIANPQVEVESGGKARKADAPDPRLEDMQKKFEAQNRELQAKFEASERARAEEREQRLRQEETGLLTAALRDAGVAEPMVRAAVALHREDGLIARSEDGAVVYKVNKGTYSDEVPVAEGVKAWLQANPSFAPPRGAAGTGAAGTAGKAGKNGKAMDKKAAARAELHKFFSGTGLTE